MDGTDLQAIKDRCERNQGRNDGAIRKDIRDLLAEIERLRCCGNCKRWSALHTCPTTDAFKPRTNTCKEWQEALKCS